MSNQKYCANCGWAVHDDKPCAQCGSPSLMEQLVNHTGRIASALESMVEPVLGGYEIEEPDFTRAYTD